MKLTDLTIRALKSPEKGAVIHYDDTLAGFGVRVSEGGTKSFILTHGARRQRETIGRVGVVSLKTARGEAKQRLAAYALGKGKSASKAWNKALDEFLAEKGTKRRDSTVKSYRRRLNHFKYGATMLDNISPQDLQKDLGKLKDRPSEFAHSFTALRVFFRWAYRKHYVETNPMERMEVPEPSPTRERTLEDAEIKKVWNAAPKDAFGRRVKLLLMCGQRPTETGHLDQCKRKGDLITIPGKWTKNKRDHTFPVPKTAEQYITKLSYGGFSKAKARLDKLSGVKGWTLHDLRRTFRTKLAELGVSKEVAEKYVNHISGSHSGVNATYDRYHYIPEMRAAAAKWEEHLLSLVGT